MKQMMKNNFKAIVFFGLLIVFTVLLVIPSKVSSAVIPGNAQFDNGFLMCICFVKEEPDCGCVIPE